MPTTPAINAVVNITSVDLNGNSVAKRFNAVSVINYDYVKGIVRIQDATGIFHFPLLPVTTITTSIVAGTNGATTVTIS